MQIQTMKRYTTVTSAQQQPRPSGNQILLIASLILIFFTLVIFLQPQATTSLDTDYATRIHLASLIQAVPTRASAHAVYQARDSNGHTMDTAKIIADPRYPSGGGYIAVYHSQWIGQRTIDPGMHYHAFVAFSKNLLDWREAAELGADASQPTIMATSTGGFLVVWEQTDANEHGNHFRLRYYASEGDLFMSHWSRQFDSPVPNRENYNKGLTLSACAEGTPNIYTLTLHPDIDHATITLGGHYNDNCAIDRQMTGVLTVSSAWNTAGTHWQESRDVPVDNAILRWLTRAGPVAGVGNIGDRDMSVLHGFRFGLFEGQYRKDDFSAFRCFLYDYQTGIADQLNIHTNKGSQAFGNPTLTSLIAPDGQSAIVITLYVFGQVAGSHENGELIYFLNDRAATPGS